MNDFRVESHNLADLSEFLHRRKSHIESAMRKAAQSVLNQLKYHVSEEVKSELNVRVPLLDKIRIRLKVDRKKLYVSLWVGSNPVLIQYLRPSVGSGGIRAGGKHYPKAFMPRKKSGDPIIFERSGKSRLPIRRPSEPIDDAVLRVIDRHWSGLHDYFFMLVRKNLNESEK